MKKSIVLIISVLILLPLTFSNQIVIEQYIKDDFKTSNNISIILKEKYISITFNVEINNLKVVEEENKLKCIVFEKKSIACEVLNYSDIPLLFKIELETDKIINENNKYDLKILTKAEMFSIITYLPLGYGVKESEKELEKNITFLSDGKRIAVFARASNITTFELSFTLKPIEKIIPPPYSLIAIIIIVIAITLTILYFYYKGKLTKERKKLFEVLDQNERKILEILMQNNPINQKKLVELTQLSKAKVSKIISSFKQRGIVDVERRGRNNIIHLKSKL